MVTYSLLFNSFLTNLVTAQRNKLIAANQSIVFQFYKLQKYFGAFGCNNSNKILFGLFAASPAQSLRCGCHTELVEVRHRAFRFYPAAIDQLEFYSAM